MLIVILSGEGGIRTLGPVLPRQHISSVPLSASQAPLLPTSLRYAGQVKSFFVFICLQGKAERRPAERQGFEPWVPFRRRQFSKLLLSTTQPSLPYKT